MNQLASHQHVLPGRLVAFPLRGNAYTECLYAALLENAMRVVRTRRYDGGAIQRHVQQFSWEDVARTMLLRLATKARESAALG